MRILLPLVTALVPLIIAPGIFFYFDVTPKLAILLIGTAVALALWRGELPIGSRENRALLALLAAAVVSLVISAALSADTALSLNGGNWRRFGVLSQAALLIFTMLVASDCAVESGRVKTYLKAITVTGIPVALYAIAQYFGFDPWLPKGAYHAGEEWWSIVRPPSTMGHADYLATYLVYAVFAAAGLLREPLWRAASWVCITAGCAAIVLSGTRAAMVGLLAGTAMLLVTGIAPVSRRKVVSGLAAAMFALMLFYWSPAGEGLRHRVNWTSSEPLGGARPLLIRDSLRMSAHRLLTGFGPETFIAEFPKYESAALARQYPDFLHESPHNILVDALAAQGALGFLVLCGLCAWGLWRARQSGAIGAAFAGGLAALMFTSFVMPTALFFYLMLALMVRTDTAHRAPLVRIAGWCCAAVLIAYAARLCLADRALVQVKAAFDRNDVQAAIAARTRAEKWHLPGSSADLYYSRRAAELLRTSTDFRTKAQAFQMASAAAARAVRTAEERSNAYYNLAAIRSMTGSATEVERSLREAIRAAPNWYKPHWVLAQLLLAEHRNEEAQREAEVAAGLNAKAPEVLHTLENIRAAQRQ